MRFKVLQSNLTVMDNVRFDTRVQNKRQGLYKSGCVSLSWGAEPDQLDGVNLKKNVCQNMHCIVSHVNVWTNRISPKWILDPSSDPVSTFHGKGFSLPLPLGTRFAFPAMSSVPLVFSGPWSHVTEWAWELIKGCMVDWSSEENSDIVVFLPEQGLGFQGLQGNIWQNCHWQLHGNSL